MTRKDATIDEIRNIRKKISLKFNSDLDQYIDYLLSKKTRNKQTSDHDSVETHSLNRVEAQP